MTWQPCGHALDREGVAEKKKKERAQQNRRTPRIITKNVQLPVFHASVAGDGDGGFFAVGRAEKKLYLSKIREC